MSKRAASDTLRDAVARTRPAPRPVAAPAPARGPDDGPDLFWDILDFHVSPHLPLPDLVSLGNTTWQLANVWRLHIKELPLAVLQRHDGGRGRLRQFPNLERLRVWANGLDDDIAELSRLTTLDMNARSLTNPAATLARLPRLARLSFPYSALTADDLRGLTALRELDLSGNTAPITADMFEHMSALAALGLFGDNIDDDALDHCPGLAFLAIETNLDMSPLLAPLTNLTCLFATACPNLSDAALAPLWGLRVLVVKHTAFLTSDALRPLAALEMLFWNGNETVAAAAVTKHKGEHLRTVIICSSNVAARPLIVVFVQQVRRLGISFFDFAEFGVDDGGAPRPLPVAFFNDVDPNPRIGPADSDDESSFSSFEDDSVDLMDL